MEKLNIYNIPIDLIKRTGLKISAASQDEAINKALDIIENSDCNDYKIHRSDITCEQDDEIIEEIVKDFNLEIKDYGDHEAVSHSFTKFHVSK